MTIKHYLPRFSWLQLACICILGLMLSPLAFAASTTAAPVAPGGGSLLGLAALGLGGMMLRAPASEEDPGGGGGGKQEQTLALPDAIKAIEDKTLPMSQRLGVALKALQGVDPTGQLATVKAELDKAKLDLSARDADLVTVRADLATANKQIAALQSDVSEADKARATAEKTAQDLQAKEQNLETRAEAKVKEKMAALGFPTSKLPKDVDANNAEDKTGPEARIRELTGSKRTQAAIYFEQHKKLPDWMG